jgi:hypothetical protein
MVSVDCLPAFSGLEPLLRKLTVVQGPTQIEPGPSSRVLLDLIENLVQGELSWAILMRHVLAPGEPDVTVNVTSLLGFPSHEMWKA